MSLSEQPDAIILWWPLSLKRFVTSALLRTPYCFNALPVLDDTAIFFTENSIPRYAVSKQCPGNLNEVHLSLPPPLFTGRLGARSFTEGLTLFPSEATSRVSSRAPGLSSRDPELGDGRHYNLSTRKLYSLFRLQLNEFFSSNTKHPCSRSHQGQRLKTDVSVFRFFLQFYV